MYPHIEDKYIQKHESIIDLNEITHVFGHAAEETTVWCTDDGRYFLCPDRTKSRELLTDIMKIWDDKNKHDDFDHKKILL